MQLKSLAASSEFGHGLLLVSYYIALYLVPDVKQVDKGRARTECTLSLFIYIIFL